ncbi:MULTISPECIES: DUF1828 domain-containing protein [Bacillati]|uniref:DUF1828 domain-containing protein n=1 Tax=Bacillati TaxID=1783272 RepID=UPI001310584E|nr:DUF1828 domain-containing protein [Stenotrophomonas maltophilia]MBH1503347.1 DUF1828 domain-containing protein [Stenotrophomonas maltophilia]MBH1784027.1 DUF1828 domain-containing protein [Stenotrophomonas maltophilia]
MNLTTIANALNGRFVPLGEHHGFIESSLTIPRDGTMLGAYLFDCGDGQIRITDDGDTLFNIAAAGAVINKTKVGKYREIAIEYGVSLTADGELVTSCSEERAGFAVPRYFEAAHRIAISSLVHRPKVSSRFTKVIDEVLTRSMPRRVTRRFTVVGASGHQLMFPFALDTASPNPILLQTVAADEGCVDWASVYQADGKFRDVMNTGAAIRRVAVIEQADATQIAQARVALGDSADVILFRSPDSLIKALAA